MVADEKMEFDDANKNTLQDLYDLIQNDATDNSWRKCAKYVTSKYSDDQSVPSLFKMRLAKQRIFESILEKFSKGIKL